MITISIIIPAYNAEQYFDRCFASIYNNNLSEDKFEVIVINDGSKDRTAEILRTLREKHINMTFVNKENEGVSVARNIGIEMAKGQYVMFLDVDDELVKGALPNVVSYLDEHKPIDMLVTRQLKNNGTIEWQTKAPSLEEHKIYDGIKAYRNHYVRTNAGGGICRREFLREHNIAFPVGVKNAEDTIFFGLLQVYAQSIVYLDLPLYRIYEVEGSASRTLDYTQLAQNHLITMQAVAEVKKSLKADREQRAVFDYVVYQLLSNTIARFIKAPDLSYKQLKKEVKLQDLLPLDTQNMYLMRRKAQILNFSLSLFYFLSWIRNNQKITVPYNG